MAVILDDAEGGVQYLRRSILIFDNGRTESLLNGLLLPIKHSSEDTLSREKKRRLKVTKKTLSQCVYSLMEIS